MDRDHDSASNGVIPAGRLVRVKDEYARCGTPSDREVVENHGRLWVTGKNDWATTYSEVDNVLYWCRALATGEEHLWFHYELEEAGDAQVQGG